MLVWIARLPCPAAVCGAPEGLAKRYPGLTVECVEGQRDVGGRRPWRSLPA
jgi:hypothetical protein